MRRAGFGQGLMLGSRPALLMIDFARAYFAPESPLYAGVEAARDAAAQVLAAARDHGVPVFHTRVEYQPGGADGGMFFRKIAALKVFEAGSPLGDFRVVAGAGAGRGGDHQAVSVRLLWY